MELRRIKIFFVRGLKTMTIKRLLIVFLLLFSLIVLVYVVPSSSNSFTKDGALTSYEVTESNRHTSQTSILFHGDQIQEVVDSNKNVYDNSIEKSISVEQAKDSDDYNTILQHESDPDLKAVKRGIVLQKNAIQWWIKYFPDSFMTTKKMTIDLLVIVSSAPKNYDRRQAIRASWWTSCKLNHAIHCVFFTDGVVENTETQKDLQYENKDRLDMNVHPYQSHMSHGEIFLYHLKWSYVNFNYEYILRLDDDNFFCVDHFFYNMHKFAKENLIWSNFFCGKDVVRPDDRFVMLSNDLVYKFILQSNTNIICHPYVGQQIALWIEELKINVTYYHEQSIYQQQQQSLTTVPATNFVKNSCEEFYIALGVKPFQQQKLWDDQKIKKFHSQETITPFNERCSYKQRFRWKAMPEHLQYTPKLCHTKPNWVQNAEKHEHSEPLQRPTNLTWEQLQPILVQQLHQLQNKEKGFRMWDDNILRIPRQKEHYQLILVVSTAAERYDRRQAIRETWWKDCKENTTLVKCLFMTDGYVSKRLRNQLSRERLLYKDIIMQPIGQGVKFGQRLLYQLRWVSIMYNYSFFMKVDDDQFLCLKRLLFDIGHAPREKLIWSHMHCEEDLIRPDESFLILSQDIVRIFLGQSATIMKCHPFADQQIGMWVKELGLKDIYFHDRRIHHHPPASRNFDMFLNHDICSVYIALHGTYGDHMKKFWEAKGPNKSFFKLSILQYHEYCYSNQEFNWTLMSEKWRYEPKLCITNPDWNITRNFYVGRESPLRNLVK